MIFKYIMCSHDLHAPCSFHPDPTKPNIRLPHHLMVERGGVSMNSASNVSLKFNNPYFMGGGKSSDASSSESNDYTGAGEGRDADINATLAKGNGG